MTLAQLVDDIVNIANTVIVPVIFALAFIVFLWGVFSYFILGASDPKKREDGKWFAFWGILGLVVLFSVWGLVNMLLSTLGISPPA